MTMDQIHQDRPTNDYIAEWRASSLVSISRTRRSLLSMLAWFVFLPTNDYLAEWSASSLVSISRTRRLLLSMLAWFVCFRSIFGAVYFRLLLSFSFWLGWYHLWSRYVQMLRCALLREKELVIELIAQNRWCNRAAVHLFLFIVSVIVLCVSSGGWSHHSECRHSLHCLIQLTAQPLVAKSPLLMASRR